MAQERDAYTGPFTALIDRGEERGCVDLKEVDALAQALDLEDEDLAALYEQLHARHIELRDDCTRQDAPEAPIDTRTSRPSPPTRCSSSSTRSAATGC